MRRLETRFSKSASSPLVFISETAGRSTVFSMNRESNSGRETSNDTGGDEADLGEDDSHDKFWS
jgi:Tol biopolymer transport system component